MSHHQQRRTENVELGGEQVHALHITVLFTTVPDTLAALRRAVSLAAELDAAIRILVAEAVPYPLPLDAPRVNPAFRLRQFHALWQDEQIETQIDIRLCRDTRECIHNALPPHSLVLIGKRKSWRPFTREKRLIRSLKRAGHDVVSVATPSSDISLVA